MREIDRRSFVKTAMAARAGAAALGLAACAPGQKQASPQAASAELPSEWTSEHDLVVIGAGGAGLAAALEASRAGASVMVLECENSHLFSNTALCGGVVMGCCSSIQKEAGVEDSVEEFKKYLDAINDGLDSQNLTHLWAEKSGETIDWLREAGADFPVEKLYKSGAEDAYADVTKPVARGVIAFDSKGASICDALYQQAVAEGAEFAFGTLATGLYQDETGRVCGVAADDGTSRKANKGVVIASAGFSRNKDMLRNFMPDLVDGASNGSSRQQGDGIVMGQRLGAKLTNMWATQTTGKGIDTGQGGAPFFVLPNWGNQCICIDMDGTRAFDEGMMGELMSVEIINNHDGFVWAAWDDKVVQQGPAVITVPPLSEGLRSEIDSGAILSANTLEELAEKIGVPAEVFVAEVDKLNSFVEEGVDKEFGKDQSKGMGNKIDTPPFYAGKIVPAFADTAGGLTINEKAEVLNVDDQPIAGLYAAGSTTGGWRGRIYPGSGTALGFGFTFGRIAAQSALA